MQNIIVPSSCGVKSLSTKEFGFPYKESLFQPMPGENQHCKTGEIQKIEFLISSVFILTSHGLKVTSHSYSELLDLAYLAVFPKIFRNTFFKSIR